MDHWIKITENAEMYSAVCCLFCAYVLWCIVRYMLIQLGIRLRCLGGYKVLQILMVNCWSVGKEMLLIIPIYTLVIHLTLKLYVDVYRVVHNLTVVMAALLNLNAIPILLVVHMISKLMGTVIYLVAKLLLT